MPKETKRAIGTKLWQVAFGRVAYVNVKVRTDGIVHDGFNWRPMRDRNHGRQYFHDEEAAWQHLIQERRDTVAFAQKALKSAESNLQAVIKKHEARTGKRRDDEAMAPTKGENGA
jgi:hypothetical protein